MKKDCAKCTNTIPTGWNGLDIHYILCWECAIEWERQLVHFNRNFIQPERSKREDTYELDVNGFTTISCQRLDCNATIKCRVYRAKQSNVFCPACWFSIYNIRDVIIADSEKKGIKCNRFEIENGIIDNYIKYGVMRCSEPDGNTGR